MMHRFGVQHDRCTLLSFLPVVKIDVGSELMGDIENRHGLRLLD